MRWKILRRISLAEQVCLKFFLKEAMEVADCTSSGSSFHILGASYAKLRLNYFVGV